MELGVAAVRRWFILIVGDSFAGWKFLCSDRENWRPPLGVAPGCALPAERHGQTARLLT